MSRKFLTCVSAVVSGAACMMTMSIAHADITYEERIAVEGAGLMAMANMSGTTTTSISGDRARIENDLQMQSRLVRMFARDAGQTTEIVRLDQDKVYDVNPKKKTYSEVSLADKRAEMAKAMDQAKQAQEKQPAPTGMDESQCEWSDPKVDVKKTGAKATIAGYNAEQTTIVATQSCKDKKSGAVCDVQLSLDQWLAPSMEMSTEQMKFYQAYAEKMGFSGASAKDVTQRAETMFGRYKGIWTEVAAKMKNSKGYPVRSSFAMAFGGPQCTSAEQAQAQQASLPPAPTAGEIGTAAATSAGQMAGETAASKAGHSAFGGVAGQIGGKIAGSLFNRRKKEEPASTETAAATPTAATTPAVSNNMVTPLRITSELVSIKKDSVPASTFEVPAGFKKVANGN
jgi:hypothetical protein